MIKSRHDIPSGDDNLFRMVMLIVVCGVLFALIIGSCFGDANATVYSIDNFSGISTNVPPQKLGWSQARKSVGWVYRDGNLERESFEQLNTGTVIDNGLTWLALYSKDRQIIFYDNDLRKYSIDADMSSSISGITDDSATVVNGDSTVTQGTPNSHWLNLVLTKRENNTVAIGGTTYTIEHFYSDSVLLLAGTYGGASADSVALNFGFAFNYLTAGSFETLDTLWMFDGNNIMPYTGAAFSGFAFPVYADSGSIDSIGTDTTLDAGGLGSLRLYGDFGTAIAGKYILWNDSIGSRRAIPQYVVKLNNNGAGNEFITVIADSALYIGEDHFGQGHRYIAADLVIDYRRLVDYDTTITATVNYIGDYDSLSYYRVTVASPPVRWQNVRGMDAGLHVIYQGVAAGYALYNLKIDSCYGTDSTILYAYGRNDYSLTAGSTSLNIYANTGVSFGQEATQKEWPYSIGELHRARANYAGNDTARTLRAVSYQHHYDSIRGADRIEGQSPITDLMSYGQDLIAIRQNQSVIRNGVVGATIDNSEARSGFSYDDFYVTPITPIIDGQYTFGPLGLGKFEGTGIRRIETSCDAIFTDSINWNAGERFVAMYYNKRLYVGCCFGSATQNNRLLVFDDQTKPISVGFIGAMKPGAFFVRRDDNVGEQAYIGQSDSSYLWLIDGSSSDRYELADWRSGMNTQRLDPGWIYLAAGFTATFDASDGDSIFFDFYADTATAAVYSDTVAVSVTGWQTYTATLPREVQGYALGYGIRTPDLIKEISQFEWDVRKTRWRRQR